MPALRPDLSAALIGWLESDNDVNSLAGGRIHFQRAPDPGLSGVTLMLPSLNPDYHLTGRGATTEHALDIACYHREAGLAAKLRDLATERLDLIDRQEIGGIHIQKVFLADGADEHEYPAEGDAKGRHIQSRSFTVYTFAPAAVAPTTGIGSTDDDGAPVDPDGPTPNPTPDPDVPDTPGVLPDLPTVADSLRLINIGSTEGIGDTDDQDRVAWFHQVNVPVDGSTYGWATSKKFGTDPESGGTVQAKDRFAEFLTDFKAQNPTALRMIYQGSANCRADADHGTVGTWPLSTMHYELDLGGADTYVEPWPGAPTTYNTFRKWKIYNAAARARFRELILEYIDSGAWSSLDFNGLHFDEVSALDANGNSSAAIWDGNKAFLQQMKSDLHARGLRLNINMGGWSFANSSSSQPFWAPSLLTDLPTMCDILQQERLPSFADTNQRTTAAFQNIVANVRSSLLVNGCGLELHQGLIDGDKQSYTISSASLTTSGAAWPGNVAYGRSGDSKLLLTLTENADSYKYIGETWSGKTTINGNTGWSAVAGPTATTIYAFKVGVDISTAMTAAGMTTGNLAGKTVLHSGHFSRLQAAIAMMAIRTTADTIAVHLSPGSSVNPWDWAASSDTNAAAKEDWTQWAVILGEPLSEPTYLGDDGAGWAGRVRRQFANGMLDLYPRRGLVEITV